MISMADFWMGRDTSHAVHLSTEIRRQAEITVRLASELVTLAQRAGVSLDRSPRTGTLVSSGWRPPAINAGTPGAAVNSKHMTGQAVDLYDPDGDLDDWCLSVAGLAELERIGLWLEHPAATKGWCHLQTVPPRSKRRVFYP